MMKYFLKIGFFFLLTIALIGVNTMAYSQDKKYKARVSAMYTKIMNKESFIMISTKYRGEDGFEPASNLQFLVFKMTDGDSLISLGKIETNTEGKAKFILKDDSASIDKDESTTFTYVFRIENSTKFEEGETSISFSNAYLEADIELMDSVHHISAKLTDTSGNPLSGQALIVGLQRLYNPLRIGEEFYETDENGKILVPINEPMPGVDGNLTYEVVLFESDAYGTVMAVITAPIGIPIVDQSTFDERTMWSPASKTPFHMLIFPNIIILGVWLIIFKLIFNLYYIYKSKTE